VKNNQKLVLALIPLIIGLVIAYTYYKRLYGSEIHLDGKEKAYLFIPTHSGLQDLKLNLLKSGFVQDTDHFDMAARFFHFGKQIKPGKYEITDGMSYKKLFRKIQLGDQVPVSLVLHDLRLRENLASFVSHHIEADSASIMRLMNNDSLASAMGFNHENFYTLFIPNTYSMNWNTSADQFFNRMELENHRFWTDVRKDQAAQHGLTPNQVMILASIVNQESNKPSDMVLIAGVYLNRLRAGIRLEADPTVVFANQDFSIRRVTQKYLAKDSPYNTYKYSGLPPGPITMPSRQAIDAVLTSPPTDYMYFCAKDDFSGYHAFAVTEAEHKENARKFHEAMNARNIH